MPSDPAHTISFSSLPRSVHLGTGKSLQLKWDRRALARRLQFVLNLICENASSVHIEFVDSLRMGELNWQFRGKDKPTDVLSFPPHRDIALDKFDAQSEEDGQESLGELAVCVDVCAHQAQRHRCTLAQELERMMIHGIVHLKGFDHERSEAAYAVMTGLEKLLQKQVVKSFGDASFCTAEAKSVGVRRSPGRRR